MTKLIFNPNNKNIAYYKGQPVPQHVAERRHLIDVKVKLGIPLNSGEYSIYLKHLAQK